MFMSCIRIPSLPQNHEHILLHYTPEVLQFCLSHLGRKYFRMSILYKIQGRFSLTVSHIHVSNCPSTTAYRGGSSPLWLAIPHYAHGSVQLLLHWSIWYLCQCHITTAKKSVSIYCNTKLLILLFFRVSSHPLEFPYIFKISFWILEKINSLGSWLAFPWLYMDYSCSIDILKLPVHNNRILC